MSGIARIILHWTAGRNTVSALDRQHYHFIIDGAGIVCEGVHAPEDNLGVLREGSYAAHTQNCNTGAIGVALAGMAGAEEAPFTAGAFPMGEVQVEALAALSANLCKRYGIPVTRQTILSHAEVQQTLGIAQRGKWDIVWLPGMAKPGNPVEVGDKIRARIVAAMGAAPAQIETPALPSSLPSIQRGDVGELVTRAQTILTRLGFAPGQIDGDFGRLTRAAVVAFQKAEGLPATGIITAAVWVALLKRK
ncbi:N-acetylmuramoyl-L-alanine amidase [Paracoccus sp. PAR01]|uniref:peptidoglycan recognition protein family protein n=1 Tax=Paracoccus sp. PAR01 TaxID=2769282 RepID=UPI0017860125|nr:N-acetylmuramoyl-L-alanine amidase [Paracoccus sp. PAR01]MBD9528668.1 N-acetylmuramoyl-L-alanine amidase [Paracoccus sp. PAR01]